MSNNDTTGMSLIVRTATRITVGFILMFGIYIFSHEEVSPGGGFAGGIIMALAFINIILSYGKDLTVATIPHAIFSFLSGMGAFLVLGLSLMVYCVGYFALIFASQDGLPSSAPVAFLQNYAALAVRVSAGMSVIFIALVLLRSGRRVEE